ncbi:long-chain fatty acid--CoA ligase [Thermoleophilia bacterium SCSIO 60948]|nr:long-chain fatty acid--CoA ligase [Thermoleophilia bacterium SCSIO 60948]
MEQATTSAPRAAARGEDPVEPKHATLFEAFEATAAAQPDAVAIREDEREQTWAELRSAALGIAGGLEALGIGRGDTVALLMRNRLEFNACDLGAVAVGAVPFSLYATSSPEQIAYMLGDAEARVAIADSVMVDRLRAAREQLPQLERIVLVDADPQGDGAEMTLAELERSGEGWDPASALADADAEDLLTLIYTSGTTGPPKGVQLTHRNLMSLIGGVEAILGLPEGEGRVISWLPAAHIAERGANYYLPVVRGYETTVCPDPKRVAEFLGKVRPTWFFAVPRVWEKLKAGLEAMVAGLPDEQREGAEKALAAATQRVRLRQAGEPVPSELDAAVEQADAQMFAPIRAQLGLDDVASVNVGAAPTPVEVLEFFHAIGIEIGELWGMSETCGVAACNPPGAVKLGTVGPPFPGIEIRIADDGEVLVRGASIMPGYRNLPDKTAEALSEDGWLHTGDVGELDADGYLKIVDRKKELLINASGKNMSPTEIESKLSASSPLIGQAVAIGDARPYNVALVVLDPDFAPVWAGQHGIEDASIEALAANPELQAAVASAIGHANARMSRVEQIKRFRIMPREWVPGGDELTPTMKLKRRPIAERYSEEIEALYAGEGIEPDEPASA